MKAKEEYLFIKNEINQSYGIRISCCANHKELEDYIYTYNGEKQQWDLIKLMEYTYFPQVSFKITYPTNIKPTNLRDSFNKLYNESKIRFKNNDIRWIENELNDLFRLGEIIENIPVDSLNLVKYNDIAYFLEQTGKGDPIAVYILEKIIKQFPERNVAYINLGDAYWGTNQKEKAKEAYTKYILQMTEQGKTSKIPKRVSERNK